MKDVHQQAKADNLDLASWASRGMDGVGFAECFGGTCMRFFPLGSLNAA